MNKDVFKVFLDVMKLSGDNNQLYIDSYTEDSILQHCAEEMCECASAINKLLRIRGDGPASTTTEEEALAHLKEELSDSLSIGVMLMEKLQCELDVAEIHLHKSNMFTERIKSK